VNEEHDRFAEQLAAYALGSLAAGERAPLEAHLADCQECARRLAEYRAVAGVLPAGLEPAAPPAGAWRAIQAEVRARGARRRFAPPPRRTRWLRAARWPAAAALVLVLAAWTDPLPPERARRSPGPAPGPEVEALSRRPGRIVILQGGPRASARIFVAVDGGGHLAVSGLDAAPPARVYQLWFMPGAGPAVSGATFRPDTTGRAWVKVAVPATLDDVRAIVVTEEPAPGSAAPTGPPLLTALPWR